MFKNFFLCFVLLCGINYLNTAEIYSLKKNYEKVVTIEGTDQISIKKGMQSGLSTLLVNLTGNSKISNQSSITKMIDSPETYVTQYKLGEKDGKIIATFIYAVPPLVRLTDLGIRLVDKEVIEAADAFGASKKQKLWGVQMPLALPNIMQGINQCTMMALSMVVIASMIGTRGLGDEVLLGLQQLNVGRAAEAGIAIVLLAIVLDRITQSYGETLQERRAPEKKKGK